MSMRSPASSRWSRGSATGLTGSPTSRSTVSSSAAVGSVRLGSVRSSSWTPASASDAWLVRSLTCAESAFRFARSCETSSPAFWPAARFAESAFCLARRLSAVAIAARRPSSSRRSSSMVASNDWPRRASADFTPSGSSRMRRRSSTAALLAGRVLARGRVAPLGLAPRVLRQELRDVLGVLAGRDVLGHDRAGEAAVADRVEHAVDVLAAHVEVRAVGVLLVGGVHRAALRSDDVERVAAGAALEEQLRARLLVGRRSGVQIDLLRAAAGGGQSSHGEQGDDGTAGHGGRRL